MSMSYMNERTVVDIPFPRVLGAYKAWSLMEVAKRQPQMRFEVRGV